MLTLHNSGTSRHGFLTSTTKMFDVFTSQTGLTQFLFSNYFLAKWTLINVYCPPLTVCILFWDAKLETSHVLQSNKIKLYRGRNTFISVHCMEI